MLRTKTFIMMRHTYNPQHVWKLKFDLFLIKLDLSHCDVFSIFHHKLISLESPFTIFSNDNCNGDEIMENRCTATGFSESQK